MTAAARGADEADLVHVDVKFAPGNLVPVQNKELFESYATPLQGDQGGCPQRLVAQGKVENLKLF